MKGTTVLAKLAMRFTPPKMMKPSSSARPAAVTFGSMSKAVCRLEPMEFACTPGSNTPQAKMVAMAKVQAYHFMPSPFSM
ncbi:hypothetical protein D3C74_404800 [compost metagenome]